MRIDINQTLSETEMAAFYGPFFARGAGLDLDTSLVPRELHPLLPYAAFWGEPDDADRAKLIDDAPGPIRANVAFVVRQYLAMLEDWLDSMPDKMSIEFVAFCNLLMVFHDPRVAGTY